MKSKMSTMDWEGSEVCGINGKPKNKRYVSPDM